jgi:anti-sigma-K factor RskA
VPVVPPPSVWRRVEAAIDGEPDAAGDVVPRVDVAARLEDAAGVADVIDLRARLARWRALAGGAMAAAAALAAVVVIDRLPLPETAGSGRYLAVVNTDGALPALVVDVDTARGVVTVRAVAAERPADRSLELWAIPEGGQPVSLGLVDPEAPVQRIRPDRAGIIPTRGLFAVSVEPVGGSPTGAPTGPVVYSGALVPAP